MDSCKATVMAGRLGWTPSTEEAMDISLNEEECALVLRLLKQHLPELRDEVYKTENFEWRQAMKAEEEDMKALIARLEGATVASR